MNSDKLNYLFQSGSFSFSEEISERIRKELLQALSKYLNLSEEATLQMEQLDSKTVVLVFSAQILSAEAGRISQSTYDKI